MAILNQILIVCLEVQVNENSSTYAGHMNKMAVMQIYGKNTLEFTFKESLGRF